MSTEALNQRFLHVPRYAIVVSIVLHISIPFAYMVAKGLDMMGIHLIPEQKKPLIKEVYQTFIQVDSIALPDQMVNDKSAVDPTIPIVDKAAKAPEETKLPENAMVEPAKQAEIKKSEMELAKKKTEEEKKKVEEEKKKVEAKKKADEVKLAKEKEKALKKLQKEAERDAALKALSEKDGKNGRETLKGNKLSKGTGKSGKLGEASDIYRALLSQHIKSHFSVLPGQSGKKLVTQIEFEILPNGRLKKRRIVKSSKDAYFDSSAMQALVQSQPLPVPDDVAILKDAVTIDFNSEEK